MSIVELESRQVAFEGAGGHVDITNLNADGSVTRDVIHLTS